MAGISMISVGVALKSKQGQNELRGIASDPDEENVINVNDFGDLYNITTVLLDAVCNGNPSNECQSVSDHSQLHYLFNNLFWLTTNIIIAPCEGYPLVSGGFPLQRVSNTEGACMPWRHRI